MEQNLEVMKFNTFENKLIQIRNCLVLMDKDVAQLYEIEPKKLRQQLKRNIDKFPEDYAFQVDNDELAFLVSQNVTPSRKHFGGTSPWVFTEKGLYMVATILKSERATQATFTIIETFAKVSRSVKKIKK